MKTMVMIALVGTFGLLVSGSMGMAEEGPPLDEGLKFSRAMQVRSLPVVAILDPQGNEVGRLVGGAEWDSPEAIGLLQYYIDAGGGPS